MTTRVALVIGPIAANLVNIFNIPGSYTAEPRQNAENCIQSSRTTPGIEPNASGQHKSNVVLAAPWQARR